MSKPRLSAAPDEARLARSVADLEYGEAFLETIQPERSALFRLGLCRLIDFIAETKYLSTPYTVERFRDDLLLKFSEWMTSREYSKRTLASYLGVVKRFLMWLDANRHLPDGFQTSRAIQRLAATLGPTKKQSVPYTEADIESGRAFIDTLASSRRTAETYVDALSKFAEFVAVTGYMPTAQRPYPIAALRTDVLGKFYEWLVAEGLSSSTQHTYLAALKRYLTWLNAYDRLPDTFNLSKAVDKLKQIHGMRHRAQSAKVPNTALIRIVTYYDGLDLPSANSEKRRDQIQRLHILRARAVTHVFFASAGRVSEVASLTRESVLNGKATKVLITGKGNKDRYLLLTQEARKAIANYCRERDRQKTDSSKWLFVSHGRSAGKALSRQSLGRIVKIAAKVLGLEGQASPHMFRHLRAQQLLDEGMTIDVLQAFLGHADVGTTRRIYAPNTNLDKMIDQVNTYGKSVKETEQDALQKQDEVTIHTG